MKLEREKKKCMVPADLGAAERAGVLPVGQRDRRVPRRRDKEKILRKVR